MALFAEGNRLLKVKRGRLPRAIHASWLAVIIDFIAVQGTFGPACVDALSKRLKVPKNDMFIGTPGDRFPHNIADLGGCG